MTLEELKVLKDKILVATGTMQAEIERLTSENVGLVAANVALEAEKGALELDVMKDILWKAWKLTPSKLNFMPYSVFVLDSSKKKYRQKLFEAGQAKQKNTNAGINGWW